MRILFRYVFREFCIPLAYCLTGFLSIYVLFELFGVFNRMMEAKPGGAKIVLYFAGYIAPYFEWLAPACLMLAALYTMWSFCRHSELIAMRASGVGFFAIVRPMLVVAVLMAVFVGWVNEAFVPRYGQWAKQFRAARFKASQMEREDNIVYHNVGASRTWNVGAAMTDDASVLEETFFLQTGLNLTRKGSNFQEVLENIESLDHAFIEMNVCPGGCINGPYSIPQEGGMIKAEMDIMEYVEHELATHPHTPAPDAGVSLSMAYPRLRAHNRPATEKEIEDVLHRTGKFSKQDELNCGACGYNTCREKAWAVVNGYADIDICLPYMRKRAESLAIDVVRNSPEGVILVNSDMNIVDTNATAMKMMGMSGKPESYQGRPLSDFFPPIEFYNAYNGRCRVENKCLHIGATNRYVSLTVSLLSEQDLLFGLMKDISDEVNYDKKLDKVKLETISTTDGLIMKQMRVAQEIASLLGETTAETKVALLNLKKMLQDSVAREDKE